MKKMFKITKVTLLSAILVVVGIMLASSIIKYNKLTDYYTEKVVAVKVDESEVSYDTINWLNVIETETHYYYTYEYEWEEEIYKIELDKTEVKNLWHILVKFVLGTGNSEKLVCHINPENANEAVLETSNTIPMCAVLFILITFITIYAICDLSDFNYHLKKSKDYDCNAYIEGYICNCPNCKSDNIGAREVHHIDRSKNAVNKKTWLYCRACDWQDVRIETLETKTNNKSEGETDKRNE